NDIMTAVSEQFGRDAHVIMGAVIDEDMQGRVEVCVLGTSDIGGRLPPRRVPVSHRRATAAPPPDAKLPVGTSGTLFPDTATKVTALPNSSSTPAAASKAAQDEFLFLGLVENRGHFERTDRNLFEGQDLDVPTYLRKGIKIPL